ncbi:MAG: hypothetical protein IJH64_03985 [Oscillospiraceae bacterium]|nr:hypothetical protein [Oscillospiraceae bacterium]
MSILHTIYQTNERMVKWAKDIQRKRKDRSDTLHLTDGNRQLTSEQKQAIIEYWKPYGRPDPIYHQYYYEKTGVFDVRFIPDDLFYTKIQFYFNDIPAAHVVDNKCYYEALFPDIRHPKTVAKRLNGYWLMDDRCTDIDNVVKKLCDESILFIKPATEACGGDGIVILENESLCAEKMRESFASIKGDLVVQRCLEQCEELKRINESSINTLRIISLIEKNGDVAILARMIRMGRAGSRLDNAHSNGISCGFDENGALNEFAYSLNGTKYREHPTSGVVFQGYCLPKMQEIEAAIKKSALRVPSFRIIAWDVTLDKEYMPTLVEANLYNPGINAIQLNNGPLFGDRTKDYLNEAFGIR